LPKRPRSVLLIADDGPFARSVQQILRWKKIYASVTDLYDDDIDLWKLLGYDIIIVKLFLPDQRHEAVLRKLRDSRVETPILILSSSPKIADLVKPFGLTADNCMIVPFDGELFVARIDELALD
jgi:two-component system cell cycle response regulator CtrA